MCSCSAHCSFSFDPIEKEVSQPWKWTQVSNLLQPLLTTTTHHWQFRKIPQIQKLPQSLSPIFCNPSFQPPTITDYVRNTTTTCTQVTSWFKTLFQFWNLTTDGKTFNVFHITDIISHPVFCSVFILSHYRWWSFFSSSFTLPHSRCFP